MKRVYAHKIVYCGKAYDNHVCQIDDDGSITLFPFTEEIYGTVFESGCIEVACDGTYKKTNKPT